MNLAHLDDSDKRSLLFQALIFLVMGIALGFFWPHMNDEGKGISIFFVCMPLLLLGFGVVGTSRVWELFAMLGMMAIGTMVGLLISSVIF